MTKQTKGKKGTKAEKAHQCSFEGGCFVQEGSRNVPRTASQQCEDCKLWFCDNHLDEHECNATEQFETAFKPQELAE